MVNKAQELQELAHKTEKALANQEDVMAENRSLHALALQKMKDHQKNHREHLLQEHEEVSSPPGLPLGDYLFRFGRAAAGGWLEASLDPRRLSNWLRSMGSGFHPHGLAKYGSHLCTYRVKRTRSFDDEVPCSVR